MTRRQPKMTRIQVRIDEEKKASFSHKRADDKSGHLVEMSLTNMLRAIIAAEGEVWDLLTDLCPGVEAPTAEQFAKILAKHGVTVDVREEYEESPSKQAEEGA